MKTKYCPKRVKRSTSRTPAILIGVLVLLFALPLSTITTAEEPEVITFEEPASSSASLSSVVQADPAVYFGAEYPQTIYQPVELTAVAPIVPTFEEPKWYTEQDIQMLARCIYYEAWCDCSDRHRELVAQVVLNRVASDLFPDTIYEVLSQPGQYAKDYYSGANEVPDFAIEKCRELAIKALEGEVICPPNVLFQSNYPGLGDGIWMEFDTFYSTTYFNYVIDD